MTACRRGDVVLVSFTGIVRTIAGTMIDRRLGSMAKRDMDRLDGTLRRSLGL